MKKSFTMASASSESIFNNMYLIISSVIFPVLAILWILCIGCCIYKGIIKSFGKEKSGGGNTTKVEVRFVCLLKEVLLPKRLELGKIVASIHVRTIV